MGTRLWTPFIVSPENLRETDHISVEQRKKPINVEKSLGKKMRTNKNQRNSKTQKNIKQKQLR